MQAKLAAVGLKGVRKECNDAFLFGSDRVDTAVCSWDYPVGIHGHTGVVNIAEVTSNCPGLMSGDTMAKLDISLHSRPKTYDIGAYNIYGYEYELSDSGHALLRTDWWGDLSFLDPRFFIESDPTIPVRKGVAKRLRRAANYLSSFKNTETEQMTGEVCVIRLTFLTCLKFKG